MHLATNQEEAQQLGEAQRRKLLAEIDRLHAEQTVASSSSARQLEALQVIHRHLRNNACLVTVCNGGLPKVEQRGREVALLQAEKQHLLKTLDDERRANAIASAARSDAGWKAKLMTMKAEVDRLRAETDRYKQICNAT